MNYSQPIIYHLQYWLKIAYFCMCFYSTKLMNTKSMNELQEALRAEFPILNQKVNNRPLVYFDNAATSQKPRCVIDSITDYYTTINSNVHRGVHTLAQKATESFEGSRESVKTFINAGSTREIVFTRGTTEAINLVAYSFSEVFLLEGDNVIVTEMEHHSNFVPWQMACQRKKAEFRVLKVDENGKFEIKQLEKLIDAKTRIIAIAHVSNVLGIVNPVEEVIALAHSRGIPVLLDGAQAVAHIPVDVTQLDCDFYVFSGHKMYAPMGIGILYGKEDWLNQMPPWQGGGEMISSVAIEKTTYNDLPYKFEAGTPNVSDAIALHEAIKFVNRYSVDALMKMEHELVCYALDRFGNEEKVKVFAPGAEKRTGALSFAIEGVHFYDAGVIFDKLGIALRTGTHCAEPLMKAIGVPGTMRISLAPYNTIGEIDAFFEALQKVKQIFC